MKKLSILMAAIMLVIGGCSTVPSAETTTATTETTTTVETTTTAETTTTVAETTTVTTTTAETTATTEETTTASVAEITAEEINKADEWQTMGDEKLGYIDLPGDWVRFFDPETYGTGMLQYSSPDLATVVSMMVYDEVLVENGIISAEQLESIDAKSMATSSYMSLEQRGLSELTAAQVMLDDIPCYQVYGLYNETGITYLFICWYFDGEDGYVHYVCSETPFTDSLDTVGYIEGSYRVS